VVSYSALGQGLPVVGDVAVDEPAEHRQHTQTQRRRQHSSQHGSQQLISERVYSTEKTSASAYTHTGGSPAQSTLGKHLSYSHAYYARTDKGFKATAKISLTCPIINVNQILLKPVHLTI